MMPLTSESILEQARGHRTFEDQAWARRCRVQRGAEAPVLRRR
ncbi:MAG: hypothetical protein ACI8RZ_000105 [Myxococcota bacterium]|jgi:hypothetical protein